MAERNVLPAAWQLADDFRMVSDRFEHLALRA